MSVPDVQQAVLVQFPIQDQNQLTQRLALFDEKTGAPYPFVGGEWTPLGTPLNGWASYGACYRKRPNGQVEMRGHVGPAGATETPFWNFPEGFRHFFEGELQFPIAGDGQVAIADVLNNGDVRMIWPDMNKLKNSNWFSLASIVFSAD